MRGYSAVLAVCLIAPQQGHATDFTGNGMLPGCELHLRNIGQREVRLERHSIIGGVCLGMVTAIAYVGDELNPRYRFCLPKGVTPDQTVRVVVAYIHSNPQRAHEPFMNLTLEALRKAWPASC